MQQGDVSLPGVDARQEHLRVHFADGQHADFHYFWLRHNCECCRHPLTRERTLCPSDVPLDIRPLSVEYDANSAAVSILWASGAQEGVPTGTLPHRSAYPLQWLAANAYAMNRAAVPPPPSDVASLEIDRAALPSAAHLAELCLARIAGRGGVLVRNAGMDTEALIGEFAASGLRLVETHFGRIEDLRTDNTTNQNTDQLGYTDAAVDLHTDQPFLEEPPRYQMLHCMQPAERGGESQLADARQAADYLRATDYQAFEMLTTVPVRFHRIQKRFESLKIAPIIELRDGTFYRVRSSYFTMAPQQLPFEQMESWYRAYARFTRLVRTPGHHYRFALRAGDFLMYDNFRMLHARTAFSGPRWVRGVYFS